MRLQQSKQLQQKLVVIRLVPPRRKSTVNRHVRQQINNKFTLSTSQLIVTNYHFHAIGLIHTKSIKEADPQLIIMQKDKEENDIIPAQISQNNQEKLSTVISRSFTNAKDESRLIFITKSLSVTKPIALSILSSIKEYDTALNSLTVLIDFEPEQIDQVNEYLRELILLSPKKKYFSPDLNIEVVRLSSLTIDKRKACYVIGGVFSITCQIFLTDLLRGQTTINPKAIYKMIIKLTEKVRNYYHYYAWMTTYLKAHEKQTESGRSSPIYYISNHPQHYSDAKQMERIYRTFFCKKIVIWPFGRAEIHKRLNIFRQKNEVKEWQHCLSHSQSQLQLYQVLMKLYNFLKKCFTNRHAEKSYILEQILYNTVNQEGYRATRGQFVQFQNIKFLLTLLENANRLLMATYILKFITENTCDVWNSNNSQVIEMIQDIQTKLKCSFFEFQKIEVSTITVDLYTLFSVNENLPFVLNDNQESIFACNYELYLSLKLHPQQNQKINELIKVIENVRPADQPRNRQEIDKDLQQLQKRIYVNEGNIGLTNLLIICANRRSSKYVSACLRNYQSNRTYIDFLMALYDYLRMERTFRLTKLKRVYDKRKIKREDTNLNPKVSGCKKHWIEQNRLILEELLCRQLDKIHQMILNYDLQMNILEEQSKDTAQQRAIFEINQEQIKINQNFNEELLKTGFKIVDISQIKVANFNKNQQIIFQNGGRKINVVVDWYHHGVEPTCFSQTLKILDPEIIVFYSPNTTLLRSLYLLQIENDSQNLKDIHIFSYENSYESKAVIHEVTSQDKAFWTIAQNRSQLHEFTESPFLRIKDINMHDSFEQAKNALRGRSFLDAEDKGTINLRSIDMSGYRRIILVDTREFKSSLPSYLYHSGFQVIPMFLKTADYILSDDIAVQKKSVHTKDLHNSLKSPRLQDQLRRMSISFKHSYLLIECQQEADCTKFNFGYLDGKSGNKSRYQLRKRVMQLMHKYGNVRLIWAVGVAQSCQFFKQLKTNKPQPDLLKFHKNQEEERQESTKTLQKIREESQRLEDEN